MEQSARSTSSHIVVTKTVDHHVILDVTDETAIDNNNNNINTETPTTPRPRKPPLPSNEQPRSSSYDQRERSFDSNQLAADTENPASPTTRKSRLEDQKIEVVEKTFASAAIDVFKLYIPIFLATILTFGVNRTVCMLVVGQYLSVHDIAIFGIGFTFYTVVGVSVPVGLGCGVDLLVGQASGRKRLDEAGQWAQTAIVVTSLATIPAIFIFLFLAGPFLSIFFEDQFATDLGSFLRFCVPYIITQTWALVLSRSLQAQKRADLPTFAAVAGAVVCVITTFKFIPTYGVNAAPVCLTFAMTTQIVIFIAYALYDGETCLTKVETWSPFAFEYWKKVASTERMKEYVRTGALAMVSIVSEWWAIDLTSAFSGALPEAHIAAFGVTWIIVTLFFTITLSMSIVSSAFISNSLSANLPKHAEYYSRVTQTCNAFMLILVSLFLTAYGEVWFGLFTGGDAEVMKVISTSLSAVIIFINLEGWHISLQGIYRGCSTVWLAFTAKVVAFSLWVLGLPGSYIVGIAITSSPFYGIQGLYLGFCGGFLVEIFLLVKGWLVDLNWSELAIEASQQGK